MGHRDRTRFARADGEDRGKSAGPGDHGNRLPVAGGQEAGSGPDGRDRQRRPRLRPGGIIAAAARAGHRYWRQILAVAIPVSLAGSGLEILIDHYVDPSDALLSFSATLGSTGISLLGTVLLSGFVCQLVGSAEHGLRPLKFLQIARSLRWRQLIAADVLVVLAVVTGFVLLVVPGLAVLTLLAVVAPVIEIEDRRVLAAVRRSVQLTRSHIWPVLLLATAPLAAVAELETIAPEPDTAGEIAAFLIVRGLAEGIAEACLALLLSELCFQLIDAHRGRVR
ncbi:MAG TPA: hypothetical protein VGI58_13160 [Streptosporangiaceae bacterium]|jgi:hypothetical protein